MAEPLEVHRPELHASGIVALVETGDLELGRLAMDELIASLGTTRGALEDPNAWFSLRFCEAFMDALEARSPTPGILDRAMKSAISSKSLGILAPLFRSFGTPAFLYMSVSKLVPRLNKVTTITVERTGPAKARLITRRREDAPAERTDLFCRTRRIQIAEATTFFDLPPATVEHPACMLRGDDACIYDVSWSEHRRPFWSWLGLGAGLVLSGFIHASTNLPTPLFAAASALLAIGGFGLGRSYELRRDLKNRLVDLDNVYAALSRSTLAHEQRYAELLEAKAAVERTVEQRTRELRETTVQLQQTLEQLKDLDRAKTDFFHNVSHELRSPLTLIVAPLEELLASRVPPDAQRPMLETMRLSAARLLRLINQLLDLAKIDAGAMKPVLSLADIGALVRSAAHSFDAAARARSVTLDVVTPDDMRTCLVDITLIDTAVTNLIANALRVSPSGSRVQVRVDDLDEHIRIVVADQGPGIAPSEQNKIFERFAQGDASKRLVGGTGIGLALVREALRLHGGDVSVSSRVGEGATFMLDFPRREGQADTDPRVVTPRAQAHDADLFAAAADSLASDAPMVSPNAPLALVAEDDPELRQFITKVLGTRFRVVSAGDGKAALACALENKPDVIVSDVAMPEMDGYQLCEAIRAHETTRATPVILLTARTDLDSVLRGFDVGANDYMHKPFHATEFLARVDVHLRLRLLTSQLARQERLASLGSLAASVAHNVRNPLSALISGLPAMRRRFGDSLDPSTQELMTIMIECAERIERMTLDLLDLSRIDRETSGVFAPGAGLLASVRMLSARFAPRVDVSTDVDESVTLHGRAGELNHVFMNLVDNALRAVGDEGGKIDVRGHRQGSEYVVTVDDSGPGVPEDVRGRIFEPFWTTRDAGEGTGLGLAIARQIVEEHGGQLSVSDSPLGGASFTLRVPAPEMSPPRVT